LNTDEVMSRVAGIVRDVFDARDAVVTRETQAGDIDGWDSLSHAVLMLRLESEFGIQFSLEDAYGFGDVGELVDHVAGMLERAPS